MKRYNYRTKKLYESVSVFKLVLDEVDENGSLIDTKEFDDDFLTTDDAIDAAYDIMNNIANSDKIDKDDIYEDVFDNGVSFVVDGVGEWDFTVIPTQDDRYEDLDDDTNDANLDGIDDDDIDDDDIDDDDIDDDDIDDDDEIYGTSESVAERFAKLRRMFESEDDDSDDSDDSDDDTDDDSDNKSDDDDSDDSDDKDQDEEMKAVIITVKKGDEDKCKDELIDAGVDEDDIEILDSDDDDDNVDIRIDVNSVMELKDYLEKKGIDLEEEIGGEIVSDDDEDDSDDDENKDGDKEEDFDFDDLGDIFGADDEEQ